MNLFADREIRRLFAVITGVMTAFFVTAELVVSVRSVETAFLLALIWLLLFGGVITACLRYFRRQHGRMTAAAAIIKAYLDGDEAARIDCDEEGELYRLFHEVNTLATVLNAHVQKEKRAREFLQNIISDISHQLKTPLAALNIYNGLLQEEAGEQTAIREFVTLSEKELDRIETLVQNLLKIARLDAGMLVMDKAPVDVADMMRDIELHFVYRARKERKTLAFTGNDGVTLLCDRDWLAEAVSNLVKNALDHTADGGHVWISWRQVTDLIQITVQDDGAGISPEDIHHIFKRFYRSRCSQDTSGVGLGLPLAKAIVEAHDGNITVDSVQGKGSTFVMDFLIPADREAAVMTNL